MKKNFLILGKMIIRIIIIFILFVILSYCLSKGWGYYYFDIIVKFISGIGAIAAGLFVYVKWQDEKTRNLYEKSLQKVYAPLMGILIRQEEYRRIEHPDIAIEDVPILSIKITTTHNKINFSKDGLKINNYTEEKDGLVSNTDFIKVLNSSEEAYGLMSPMLFQYMKSYELLLKLEADKRKEVLGSHPNISNDNEEYNQVMSSLEGKTLRKVIDRRYETEKKLIKEIVYRYNECVEKLGMYKERIILEEQNEASSEQTQVE